MHLHALTVLPADFVHEPPHERLGGSIFGVQRKIDLDAAVVCAVEIAQRGAGFAHGVHRFKFGRVEHRNAVGKIRLRAGLAESARFLVEPEIHIRRADDAEAQHFRRAQQRAPVNRVVVEVIFKGENALREPVLQLEVFSVAAQERHGRVAVAVVKGGHKQPVRAADGFPVILFGALRADIGNPFAFRGDAIMLLQPFRQKNRDIFKQHMRKFPFRCIFQDKGIISQGGGSVKSFTLNAFCDIKGRVG